jgi:hypothetical protein
MALTRLYPYYSGQPGRFVLYLARLLVLCPARWHDLWLQAEREADGHKRAENPRQIFL